jgi:hypothetical protein
MRSTEILAIALGLFASTAYSAPTGSINGRGPQTDTRPAEDAVNDAVNRLRPASTLKSRGLQLDTRAPQDPVSDAINRLRPSSSRRSAQAPDAVFESIEGSLNPSSRQVRSAQVQGRIEDDGRNNNRPQPNPPSRRSAQAPDAVFESIEGSLNPSSRRSAQGENRNENGIRPNVPQAQGPPSLKTRSPQTASNNRGPGQASSSEDSS